MKKVQLKDKIIQIYYSETLQNGKKRRHFIHKRGGLYASILDARQGESNNGETVVKNYDTRFTVNHNPALIELYKKETRLFVDFGGNIFQIVKKPDQYDYSKGDIKIYASFIIDKTKYAQGDIYDEDN